MAQQISINSGSGAQQVTVTSPGNVSVTLSRSVIGTVANVVSANYANFAGTAFNVLSLFLRRICDACLLASP